MSRLTDHDRRFGPITYARTDWKPLRLVFSTGDREDEGRARNTLTAYAFGWCARIYLPTMMQPYAVRHTAGWDAATVARMGRNWYEETFPREYGFSLHDGFLQVFLGPQTHDSRTTKSWCKHLPWTQWRHVRFAMFDLAGQQAYVEYDRERKQFEERWAAKEAVPKARFEIADFDDQVVQVETHIEEREWRFGEGWFKWLSLFRRPMIKRSLDIKFDKEVGPEKGSWKGGMCGHSIEMLPGELHEAAFRRYCEKEQRAKYSKYRIKFLRAL